MAEEQLDLELTVIELGGWHAVDALRRDRAAVGDAVAQHADGDTALVYPGMCLVEGTELSEGRGTTRPFELAGAPYLDPYRLVEALDGERLPGVTFRPVVFRPTFHKHGGLPCGGVQQHVTDPTRTGRTPPASRSCARRGTSPTAQRGGGPRPTSSSPTSRRSIC
jgi:uncharacterized protein YbbC (DUF1343 family)